MHDPITVSVLTHRFEAIVQEMGEAMLRTAYSQILNSSRDFSTAVFDGEGRLAAQAEHVPIHVGALPWAVAAIRDFFTDRVRPGDLFLLSDPYHGGNHLPDLTVLLPVFVDGRPVFWSINRAHQHDIGGATHGTYNPGATEIWQEGIRITPLKLYDAGELREDVLTMLATNVRHPRDFRGDLRAMIGSARVGERRLLRLVGEYGLATVTAAVAEAMLKALARSCPDRVMAGWSKRFRIALQGVNPRTGRPFIWHLFHARGGGGASVAGDGWPTAGEGQAAGGIKFGSIEVTETRFPLFFARHEFRPDSGGDGRFRGGLGSVLELRMETRAPARANTAGGRARYPPLGLFGAAEGTTHRYRLVSKGRTQALKTKAVGVPVLPGDVFLIESSGGGGYGPPGRRAPGARAEDLANGVVTRRERVRRRARPGRPVYRIATAAAG